MTRIFSLAVRVVTSNDLFAGTSNNVWFNIGPLGWKLGSDFDRGSDHTFDLDLQDVDLNIEDIAWLRIEKKADFGVTGTTDFPFNDWLPESIHLIVNGGEYISFQTGDWLTVSRPIWINLMPGYDPNKPDEFFTRCLRMRPNDALTNGEESIAWLSTNFGKNLGYSGWYDLSFRATAIGTVLRTPAQSTDGLATIDLRLEAIEINGIRYFVDGRGTSNIHLQRYIRVEYKFRNSWPLASGVNVIPTNGQRMRISGEVKWDSDDEGWPEIHPSGPNDLEWLEPPPKLINLTSSYSEVLGPPETGIVHWPGCNVKGTPKEWGPRDFTYQKVLVHQLYEFGAVVQDMGPHTEIIWTVNGQPLSQWGGTFQSYNVLVSYHFNGLNLQLWNQPEGGDATFKLKVSINDPYEPTSREIQVYFDGIRITYEPDYYRIVGGCSLAKFGQNQRLKTIPEAVPHYDPASLYELDHGVLVDLVGEIAKEQGLSPALKEASQVSGKEQIISTLLGLSVRYPETAGRIIPGRIN